MPVSEPVTVLGTAADLENLLLRSQREPVVLYKHSTYCGLSVRARQALLALDEPTDPPVYEVVVQHARELSHDIARRLGVRHETPQAIVLYRGQPVFHTSHGGVTAGAIRQALSDLSTLT